MPVKKPIRRKQATRRGTFAWTSTPVEWTRASLKRAKHFAPSIDRPMLAALLFAGAMILVMLVVGFKTTPVTGVSADEPRTIAAVQTDASTDKPTAVSAADEARSAQSATEARVDAPQMVTIAGCLAQDGESFRLKNTSGTDVPRARSWKSGFLKKRPASVEVVDASHRLKLTNHVGERISVTGSLVDGGMQVRALRRIATSCTESKPKAIA